MSNHENLDYGYRDGAPDPYAVRYLWKPLLQILEKNFPQPARLFDVGCGNGSAAHMLQQRGWRVTGIDPSETGIAAARQAYPDIRLDLGSAYDDLAAKYGRFPAVVSLEVVEHCYDPRRYARTLYNLLEDNGTAIISTPYHGYLKYLAIALTGKMDSHLNPLWDCGHIKFWSIKTLTQLLTEAGFRNIEFRRVGRVPVIATSMIAIARR